MPKKIFIQALLLNLLFYSISYSQKLHYNNSNWEKENLKGNVESYIEISNIAIEKNGKIVQYSKKTSWAGKDKFIFNNQGNLVEKHFYNYTKGDLYSKWTYKYDTERQLIECRMCFTDLASTKCHLNKYIYEKEGNKIVVRHYEIREFFPEAGDGDYVRTKWIYTYDKEQKYIIKSEEYRGEDDLQEKITYTYDENGNLIKENCVYNNKEHSIITYKYNEKGNVIEKKFWCDYYKEINKTIRFDYDENGNIVTELYASYEGDKIYSIYTYQYKYDKKGNWTECIKYKIGEPDKVLKRTYKYFN